MFSRFDHVYYVIVFRFTVSSHIFSRWSLFVTIAWLYVFCVYVDLVHVVRELINLNRQDKLRALERLTPSTVPVTQGIDLSAVPVLNSTVSQLSNEIQEVEEEHLETEEFTISDETKTKIVDEEPSIDLGLAIILKDESNEQRKVSKAEMEIQRPPEAIVVETSLRVPARPERSKGII